MAQRHGIAGAWLNALQTTQLLGLLATQKQMKMLTVRNKDTEVCHFFVVGHSISEPGDVGRGME